MADRGDTPAAVTSDDTSDVDAGRLRLVVVGGGITGLAAAWEASRRPGVHVTVLEAADRFGGKVRTSPLSMGDGSTLMVDEGADAFLARVPDAVQLCRELGLDDELTQPATGRAKVYSGGQLHFMPTDTVLGVPLDVDQLATSGILSPEGLEEVRAEADDDRWAAAGAARPTPGDDMAIGEYLAGRFGHELVARLVGPLIGGINAGDVEELSLRAVTPQLADAADAAGTGSLMEALRRTRAAAPPAGPVFHALLGGTERLVEALVEQLQARGVDLRTDAGVERIRPIDGGAHRIELRDDGSDGGARHLDADAVLLAVPAPKSAALLRKLSADAAAELEGITHSSPVLVTLVYRRQDIGEELDASGFLVARDAGLLVTAASFGSSKWAHWDDGRHVVLRVSAGHAHDDRPMQMSDDEVVRAIRADLADIAGIAAEPITARVSRYPDGFAQYTVGHLQRVDRIEAALRRDQPAIAVAGAAYRGVGIPACIRQGREAARSLVDALVARDDRTS